MDDSKKREPNPSAHGSDFDLNETVTHDEIIFPAAESEHDDIRTHTGNTTINASDPSSSAHPPIQKTFGRFRQAQILGKGGMGTVYQAYDPHLQRQVAVKELHNDDPEAMQRFIREARAQARVQHENICQIYEVGETDGKPFIVMQFIDGHTLSEHSPKMTLEQKVLVMIRVASAAHEAHKAGLVHRDIKPSNIMVEESEDGTLNPRVLDFGIARPMNSPSMTADGSFLGTPAYSAPEQVRGESKAIDRRTDVYALGATLYSLLSGAPPFSGPTPSVLFNVLDSPPKPLRSNGIPTDIETITLKCLEKEPRRRYQSAKAVAEDLQRYIDGDPIHARPVSTVTRLLMHARKYKVTVTISAVALILLTAALTWSGFTRWQSKARERLVREFTSQVESIEAEARYSRMAPLHDIGPDQSRLRKKMDDIRQQIEKSGAFATGPGHYALGRGNLALGYLEGARHHLELAWKSGYQDARVAETLAITLSSIFRDKIAEIEALADGDLRAARRQQLEEQYQQPAIELMLLGAGSASHLDRYAQALVEMHKNQLESALSLLDDSHDQPSWIYEARVLKGDILRQRALLRRDQGDSEGSKSDLISALDQYQAAIQVAPSDLGNRLAAAQTQQQLMLLGEFEKAAVLPHYNAGLQHMEAAATITPQNAGVDLLVARLHLRMAERIRHGGEDATEYYDLALANATSAAEEPQDNSAAFKEIGVIHSARAQLFKAAGKTEEQRTVLAEAIEALNHVLEVDRDYRYFTTLGVVFKGLADDEAATGNDAREEYQKAIAAYQQADLRHPGSFVTRYNLGVTLRKLASTPQTQDRIGLVKQALAAFEQARATNPNHPAPLYYLGLCSLDLAQGGDPFTGRLGPEADTAIQYHRKGLDLNPNMFQFHSAIGEVLYLQALQAWDRGEDPEPLFSESESHYQAGIELNPRYPWLHLNRAWVNYYRGKYRIRAGLDPGENLDRAAEQAQQAFGLSNAPGATLCIGSVWRMRAEYDFVTGRTPAGSIQRAKDAFSEVTTGNTDMPSVNREMGRLLTLEARVLGKRGKDPSAVYEEAGEALKHAIELKPEAPTFCLAEARRCLRMAQWQLRSGNGNEIAVTRGLRYADHALTAKPDWAEAKAVRAALLIVGDRDEEKAGAHTKLRNAINANPYLEFEWGPLADGARRSG